MFKNNEFYQETENEIDDEVDILMSTDIVAAQMSTKKVTFTRSQRGWVFKEDRTVSNVTSYCFVSHNAFLMTLYFATHKINIKFVTNGKQ